MDSIWHKLSSVDDGVTHYNLLSTDAIHARYHS